MRASVIVPAYNSQKSVGKCIEALLKQSYNSENYEVIVVDDGSTDKTADVIKAYPVGYIYQKNQGPAVARNAGVNEAKGEIILFTDADCIPDFRWVEEMLTPFKDSDTMAVKGAYKTKQRTLISRFAQIEFEERFEMLKKIKFIDMVDTYSAGYRKSVFLSLGGFDPSFPVANNEDTELSYKMSRKGYKMVFNPNAIVYHLNHPDSLKRYAKLKFWRGYWRMLVYKKYPDKIFKDSYTPQNLKLQILFLFLFLICIPTLFLMPKIMLYPLIFSLVLFILSSLPFTRVAFKYDIAVCLLSPLLLSMRAASLGLGTIWAIISLKKPINRKMLFTP